MSRIKSFKSFTFLSLSNILEDLMNYPTLFAMSWLLLSGYTTDQTGVWVQGSSTVQCFAIFSFTVFFNRYLEGRKTIGAVATCLINPVVLQALIMISAPNFFSANKVPALLTVLSFLIKLKAELISILKNHVLPSRWKELPFLATRCSLSTLELLTVRF